MSETVDFECDSEDLKGNSEPSPPERVDSVNPNQSNGPHLMCQVPHSPVPLLPTHWHPSPPPYSSVQYNLPFNSNPPHSPCDFIQPLSPPLASLNESCNIISHKQTRVSMNTLVPNSPHTRSPPPYDATSNSQPSSSCEEQSQIPRNANTINESEGDGRDIVDNRSRSSSPAEIVDIEETQPCIVDLTEDDDVEIVSTEEPVVYLGSEPARRRSQISPSSPQGTTEADAIVVQDSPIRVPSSPAISNSTLMDDHTSTNQSVIIDDEIRTSQSGNWSMQWPFSNTSDVALDLRRPTTSSILDAPIPDHVMEDIRSIYAENSSRRHVPYVPSYTPNLYPNSAFPTPVTLGMITPRSQANISVTIQQHTGLIKAPIKADPDDATEWSCPICFETKKDVKKHSKGFSSTTCGHVFCTPCLEASLKRAKLCPICRKKLSKKQYHTVFI